MVAHARPQDPGSHRSRCSKTVGCGLKEEAMRIAVVHDYFTQLGGAEKVAEELMRMLPQATLHSTVALADCMPPGLGGVPVVTSWMQQLPFMRQCYRLFFLLYPFADR